MNNSMPPATKKCCSEINRYFYNNNGHGLTSFLELGYDELKIKNLALKKAQANGKSPAEFEKEILDLLKKEKNIKTK